MLPRALRSPLAAVLLLIPLVACSATPRTIKPVAAPGGGRLITAEEIQRSGANNAWDVLRRSGTHLTLAESRGGEPRNIRRRGAGSIYLSELPLVVVDGVQVIDFRYLQQIPANIIASIHILTGTEGTPRYGTGAGNGVIVVETGARLY